MFKNKRLNPPDEIVINEGAEHLAASEVAEGLKNIFDEESDDTNMARLKQTHHSTAKSLTVGVIVFLALLTAVSWVGFFMFRPQNGGFAGERVQLTVDGPDTPKTSEPVTYLLRWKNGEGVSLGTASLELRLPKQFRVLDSPVQPDGETLVYKIGSVAPGRDGQFAVKGVFLATEGKEMDMQAILTYRPTDFNSEFQKVATKGIKLTGSALALTVTAPPKVLPGDKVTIEYRWKNTSELESDDVRLDALLPEDFVFESSEPAPAADTRSWPIGKIAAGGEGVVTVHGSFAPGAEGERNLSGALALLAEGGEVLPQAAVQSPTTVFKGDLVAALIMNGQTVAQPVRFGDTQRFAITWKNSGTMPAEDIELTAIVDATPDASLLMWNLLKDKAAGVRNGSRLTWTKKQVPALARIEPGEEGTLEFEVPLAMPPTATPKDPDFRVTASLEAKVAKIGGDQVDRTVKTTPVVGRLLTDVILSSEARYFDEDNLPVGTGPLPPKVGERTTYRVNWVVTNSLHELTNLKLSAKLPDGITWAGWSSVDAGDLKFDAGTSKMVWTLNRLPTSVQKLNVSFDVALVPGDDARSRFASLLEATILEATDKLTGDAVLETVGPLTTQLPNDDAAVGKGKVQ
jgi:hypothetical protein